MSITRKAFEPEQSCPLDGIRVLDLSRLVSGNMLTLVLADFGAEVVKVEPPGRGDPLRDWQTSGISTNWKVYARNKKSIGLNLRRPEGREVLLRLLPSAQVMVENFRPGTLETMGLGPEVLLRHHPKLVLVRVSGFGQTGPYRTRPGFGTLVEAMSGFASMNGFADREPVLPPLALADCVAGLYGAAATMIALRNCEMNGGEGQVIDLPLLEPIFSILGPQAANYALTQQVKQRTGSLSTTAAPRNVYQTADGKWLAISASMQAMAERLLRALDLGHLLEDPRFATNTARVEHNHELDPMVGAKIRERTLAENLALFEQAEVTAAPVYDISQIVEDPHVQERDMVVELPDPEMGWVPMHNVIPGLSGTPGAIRRPAPRLGEHNGEVLGSIGIGAEELQRLRHEGVIFDEQGELPNPM